MYQEDVASLKTARDILLDRFFPQLTAALQKNQSWMKNLPLTMKIPRHFRKKMMKNSTRLTKRNLKKLLRELEPTRAKRIAESLKSNYFT